jgi:predicted nucleic acid-binding protein
VILADTTVWIDFLAGRSSAVALRSLLAANRVVCHPAVRGEIALGSIARRDEVLRLLSQLPHAPTIGDDEVFALIETSKLSASGIGWIDAHLLASAMAGKHLIWTRDKRLAAIASRLGALADPAHFEPK